jgi:hypothetical protein
MRLPWPTAIASATEPCTIFLISSMNDPHEIVDSAGNPNHSKLSLSADEEMDG